MKMSSSTYEKDSCNGLQIMDSKGYFTHMSSKLNFLILPPSYAFLDKCMTTIENIVFMGLWVCKFKLVTSVCNVRTEIGI